MRKIYHGWRELPDSTDPGPVMVTVADPEGDPITNSRSYPLAKRWPWSGFNWGYHGSGPRHLAYALLADATGDAAIAGTHCQQFKDEVISKLGDEWWLDEQTVLSAGGAFPL